MRFEQSLVLLFQPLLLRRKLNAFLKQVEVYFFDFAYIHTSWETL